MAISTEDFVKQIETMSVLDLSNLVKALEDRFGVSAAAAAAPAAAARPGCRRGPGRSADRVRRRPRRGRRQEDQRHQGSPRSDSLGLKEAKDLVEGAPRRSRKASRRKRPTRSRRSSKRPAPRSRSSRSPFCGRLRRRISTAGGSEYDSSGRGGMSRPELLFVRQ